MRKTILHITCGLLLATGWANALAQGTNSPAQRLNLELVDNVSNYNIATQQNEYTNTLRLSQPTSDNKLTAGMLNNGDNIITIARQGIKDGANEGNAVDFASINLNAQIYTLSAQSEITFIDYEEYSSSAVTLTAPWASSGLTRGGTYNYFRISSGGYIQYTIPEGYDADGFFSVYIAAAQTGSFRINNSTWTISSTGWNEKTLRGLHSGDQITITGPTNSNSPYFAYVVIDWAPRSFVPTIELTPTTTANGATTTGTVATYSPNDVINLNGLADIVDNFTAGTSENAHPDQYKYEAKLDANIAFPSSASSSSFSATADFSTCYSDDSSVDYFDPATGTFTGEGNWFFYQSYGQRETNCGYIEYYGSIIFTMPNTFTGNSINVTVTSGTSSYGAGDLVVNGQSHTFTAGETYTWTLPVSANGTIEFKSNEDTWSVDFATIVISGASGSSLNAPSHALSNTVNNTTVLNPEHKTKMSKDFVKGKKAFKSIAIIND